VPVRRLLNSLLRFAVVLFLLYAVLGALVPRVELDRAITFDASAIGPDVDAYLANTELQFSDIRPGVAKRVIWAGAVGAKTPLAVIYIHGFSASSEEIRPGPDQVAKALGANLFFTRLAGHGRTSDALASATANDWWQDMAEAMAIGRRLGDRVLVISTSTGGTLAALAAADPQLSQNMAGIVMISPNLGLKPWSAMLLDLPAAQYWLPWIAGDTRSFAPLNDGQAAYWTTTYPTTALLPVAALVRAARAVQYFTVKVPLLVFFSPQDQVVNPVQTQVILSYWGGPLQWQPRSMGPGDDPYSHVLAGDILSPGQTAQTVDLIVAWAKGL
jgi:esterase/lipase